MVGVNIIEYLRKAEIIEKVGKTVAYVCFFSGMLHVPIYGTDFDTKPDIKSYFLFVSEKRTDTNGRVYFVHHPTRTTQWEDPRSQG